MRENDMAKTYDFVHDQAQTARFVADGLRAYFEYRDLGIENASKGDFVAHVIRAREGDNATGVWHSHDCSFQMIYVLNGWAKCHREIEHSADFEVLEIVSPADFGTREES
jgi:hypothetical protein